MIKRLYSFLLMLVAAQLVVAQAPSGYYDDAKGKSGKSLKTALHSVIADHVVRTYDDLWTDFRKTDCRKTDGKVWDMYSNCTNYSFGGSKQGANYKKEGDSYNREHSFPKSWFGGKVKPMYTDLFHLYPTDGYINNRRSSFPFGETKGDTYTSNGDWSKVGSCTTPGYTGTVFEPNDEYKGDFARTYFYMATCYEDKIAGWNSPMLSHDSYTAYAPWALNMLLRWAKEDPVSQKEIDRNNAVFGIQKNRNPYIDYPGLEQYVWGDKTSTAFDPDNYDSNIGGGDGEVDPQPNPQPEEKIIYSETFATSQGAFSLEDKLIPGGYKSIWTHDDYKGNAFMKATAFSDNQCHAAESWLISPNVDLTTVTDCTLSFDQAANFFKGSDGYNVMVRPEGGEWTKMEVAGKPVKDSWDFVTSTVDLNAFSGKNIQFAFVYTSTNTVAGTWEIQNVKVCGKNGGVTPEPEPQPNPDDKEVAVPSFSIPSGTVMMGTQVTISCSTAGASIYYTVNKGELKSNYGSATLTINETSEIEAYAMLGENKSATVNAIYEVEKVPEGQGKIFKKVYTEEDLVVGAKYLIVCEDANMALAGISGFNENVRDTCSVTIDSKIITTEVSKKGYPYALVLGKDEQGYTLFDEVTNTYLAILEDTNTLPSVASAESLGAHWTVSWSQGNMLITNAEFVNRSIRYNPDSPRFSTYKGKEKHVALYKESSEVVPDPQKVEVPVFSLAAGEVRKGTPVTITCATPRASICYTVNSGVEQEKLAPLTLTIEENTTIEAYAQLNGMQSEKVKVTYVLADAPVVGNGSFVKISNPSELTAGSRYLIVCEGKNKALGEIHKKYREAVDVEITANTITTEVSSAHFPYALTLGGNENGYTLFDEASSAYLGLNAGSDNNLDSLAVETDEGALWKITFEEGNAIIRNVKYDNRFIQFNFSTPRFSTYKNTQGKVALYKEIKGDETIEVSEPQFSVASGEVKKGTKVEISCPTENSVIYYAINNGDWVVYDAAVGLVVNEAMTVSAYAKVDNIVSDTVKAEYTLAKDVIAVAAPQFSVVSGEVKMGTKVQLSSLTENASIHYAINGGAWNIYTEALTVDEPMTIEAYAKVDEFVSDTVKAVYTIAQSPEGTSVFVKINSVADLKIGNKYLIVCEEFGTAMAEATGKDFDIRGVADVTIEAGQVETSLSTPGYPYALILGGDANGYTLYDETSQKYLAFTGKSNRLPSLSESTTNETLWNIHFVADHTEIVSVKDDQRMIMYNNDQPRFVAYTAESGQHNVALYGQFVSTGIDYLEMLNGTVDVYTLDGRLLRNNIRKEEALKGLARGFYIVGGLKVLVR